MESQLSILIGLPRSGKTTFSKKWKNEGNNRVVVSGDDVRYATYNQRFCLEGEERVRENFIVTIKTLLHAGYDVLADETNTSIPHITDLIFLSRYPIKAYINHCHVDTCVERAKRCGHIDLIPSIHRMYSNLYKTLPLIYSGKLKLDYEELGPEFLYMKTGYWNI